MLNIETFLQQYVVSQLTRMFLIALILIALLLIFNTFILKRPLSLYLALITLLPLGLSAIVFFFTPILNISIGGLHTVGIVWLPFFVNSFYIIAAMNKESRIITNTNDPVFLLQKELIRDTIIQNIVLVITIVPLIAVLPQSFYVALLVGGAIAIVSMWVSYYIMIRKI